MSHFSYVASLQDFFTQNPGILVLIVLGLLLWFACLLWEHWMVVNQKHKVPGIIRNIYERHRNAYGTYRHYTVQKSMNSVLVGNFTIPIPFIFGEVILIAFTIILFVGVAKGGFTTYAHERILLGVLIAVLAIVMVYRWTKLLKASSTPTR